MNTTTSWLPDELRASVCVIGAGPAGISCAMELAKRHIDVILIEGGGYEFSVTDQDSTRAEIVDARTHAPMEESVRRIFGGTSWLWGGRCLPLDPVDFVERTFASGAHWPIAYEDLLPFYESACEYANCGNAVFSIEQVQTPTASKPISEGFVQGLVCAQKLERWSGEPNFARRYRALLSGNRNVTTLIEATCVSINLDTDSDDVRYIEVVRKGRVVRVKAKYFVLACGGLETTRLLLNSNLSQGNRLGNRSGVLGKFYMGHISGKIASAVFSGGPDKTVSGFERDKQGYYVRRRFTLSPQTQVQNEVLNTALWLDNHPLADAAHGDAVLSAAYLALTTPFISKFLVPKAIASSILKAKGNCDRLAHVLNVLKDPVAVAAFIPAFAYRRYVQRPRLPGFFLRNSRNTYAIHYHAEQLPREDSSVSLSVDTDRNGLRRLRVNLKYSHFDAESVVRCHDVVDKHLRKTGAGELKYWYSPEQRIAAVFDQAGDGFHQIGTTRMSKRWQDGVVNQDCRVFGTTNLFVASSSVFPSSGQANPTLTIIALSVRIAKHVASLSGGELNV